MQQFCFTSCWRTTAHIDTANGCGIAQDYCTSCGSFKVCIVSNANAGNIGDVIVHESKVFLEASQSGVIACLESLYCVLQSRYRLCNTLSLIVDRGTGNQQVSTCLNYQWNN